MIKVFISYRRIDAAHAAQRTRACLQAKFGTGAVFIDREIPAGEDWAKYLKSRLEESTDVIVLVGDAFLRELKRGAARGNGEQDWLKLEIRTAIEQEKRIYPVLIGSLDMPSPNKLPEEIRKFAARQAVFAREPAFDAAMSALAKSIAEEHGWIEPQAPSSTTTGSNMAAPARALALALAAIAGLWLTWLTGLLVEWLAGTPPGAAAVSTFWTGAVYALATALWGLGPYLLFRAVADVRARAKLPIHNLNGLLTLLNLILSLWSGGTFLLLSTRADWALRLMWVMPDAPHPLHYAMQGVALLLIVFATAALGMAEPLVRRWSDERRGWGMAALNALAFGVMLAALWFTASVHHSLPAQVDVQTVPMLGYFMIAPALSGLLLVWDLAQSAVGLSGQSWRSRTLIGLAIALYLACTIGYFAHGPLALFIAPR